ncbi:AraC family transcriptional regulator [Parabacteroides distasonis]
MYWISFFGIASHFTNAFKRKYGTSPKEYRQEKTGK